MQAWLCLLRAFSRFLVSGFVSWRDKLSGSWYVENLDRVLEEYAGSEDLQYVLLRVNAVSTHPIYPMAYPAYIPPRGWVDLKRRRGDRTVKEMMEERRVVAQSGGYALAHHSSVIHTTTSHLTCSPFSVPESGRRRSEGGRQGKIQHDKKSLAGSSQNPI